MANNKLGKAALKNQHSAVAINKDITETIRSSYQIELKTQTQTIQSLKKSMKTMAAQLSKLIAKRRVLKKKRMALMKKGDAKQIAQAKDAYQAAMEEVRMQQQAMVHARQDLRLAKEQVKKIYAIIRSIQKMEKRWDKAIALKFRSKTPKKKVRVTKVKKEVADRVKVTRRRGRPAKATGVVVESVKSEVLGDL